MHAIDPRRWLHCFSIGLGRADKSLAPPPPDTGAGPPPIDTAGSAGDSGGDTGASIDADARFEVGDDEPHDSLCALSSTVLLPGDLDGEGVGELVVGRHHRSSELAVAADLFISSAEGGRVRVFDLDP